MNTKIIAFLLGIVILIGGYYLVSNKIQDEAANDELNQQLAALALEKQALVDENTKLMEAKEVSLSEFQGAMDMNDKLMDEINELKAYLEKIEEGYETPGYPDEASLYVLKDMGIEDYSILSDSLMNMGDEMIGYEGILGGTMHFISVKVLNDRWVFARFEDGHYGGYGIYEFRVSDGNITWQAIAEYTDN